MAKGLTEKQRKILEFIIDFQRDNGFPPTIRELGDAFEIGSLRGVTVHLDALVRKGCMTRDRTSRSIRITTADPRAVDSSSKFDSSTRLPLVRALHSGDVVASKIAHEGQVERYISVPEEIGAPATENGFVIRVGATGIPNEPILPGDLLIVRPQNTAALGELVVTLSHGDMVVTRAETNVGTLESAVMAGGEILGRVVGLLRRY
jgi:repressor LexA